MKKTAICLLLVVAVLAGAASCAPPKGTPGESETGSQTETEGAATVVDMTEFPPVTAGERSLIFRYYYLGAWIQLCSGDDDARGGAGDPYDPDTPPDAQYYKETKNSAPTLWSDELAVLAADNANATVAVYNKAAGSDGFKLDRRTVRTIGGTVDTARSQALQSGLSFEDYLTANYGEGFTPDIYKRILTVEQVVFSYTMTMQNYFIAKRSSSGDSFEAYSEQADDDARAYFDDLLAHNTEKFFVSDVCCTDAKQTALEHIRRTLSGDAAGR